MAATAGAIASIGLKLSMFLHRDGTVNDDEDLDKSAQLPCHFVFWCHLLIALEYFGTENSSVSPTVFVLWLTGRTT